MDIADNARLREFLKESLNEAGDHQEFSDDSSLFISGRLDSLSMTRLVMFLEEAFDIDFGAVDFEVELIDSISHIKAFVDTEMARRV